MMYRLIVLNGALTGHRVTIPKTALVIGRGPDCDFSVPDEEMGIKHAILEHRAEGLFVRDLGTMNRILLNGREVREARLKHGDEIELGQTRFMVQALVQAEVASRKARRRARQTAFIAIVLLLLAWSASQGFMRWRRAFEDAAARRPGPTSPGPTTQPDAVTAAAEKTERPARRPPPPLTEAVKTIGPAKKEPPTEAPSLPAPTPFPEMPLAPAAPPAAIESPEPTVTAAEQPPAEPDDHAKETAAVLAEAAAILEAGRAASAAALTTPATPPPPPATAPPAVQPPPSLAPPSLPSAPPETKEFKGRLVIQSMEQNRFPVGEDAREMRTVTVRLGAQSHDTLPDAARVRVEIVFYDQDENGQPIPTRATVPQTVFQPQGPWQPDAPPSFTATYTAPLRPAQNGSSYLGYAVRVYYDGALHAEDARPASLKGMAIGRRAVGSMPGAEPLSGNAPRPNL